MSRVFLVAIVTMFVAGCARAPVCPESPTSAGGEAASLPRTFVPFEADPVPADVRARVEAFLGETGAGSLVLFVGGVPGADRGVLAIVERESDDTREGKPQGPRVRRVRSPAVLPEPVVIPEPENVRDDDEGGDDYAADDYADDDYAADDYADDTGDDDDSGYDSYAGGGGDYDTYTDATVDPCRSRRLIRIVGDPFFSSASLRIDGEVAGVCSADDIAKARQGDVDADGALELLFLTRVIEYTTMGSRSGPGVPEHIVERATITASTLEEQARFVTESRHEDTEGMEPAPTEVTRFSFTDDDGDHRPDLVLETRTVGGACEATDIWAVTEEDYCDLEEDRVVRRYIPDSDTWR